MFVCLSRCNISFPLCDHWPVRCCILSWQQQLHHFVPTHSPLCICILHLHNEQVILKITTDILNQENKGWVTFCEGQRGSFLFQTESSSFINTCQWIKEGSRKKWKVTVWNFLLFSWSLLTMMGQEDQLQVRPTKGQLLNISQKTTIVFQPVWKILPPMLKNPQTLFKDKMWWKWIWLHSRVVGVEWAKIILQRREEVLNAFLNILIKTHKSKVPTQKSFVLCRVLWRRFWPKSTLQVEQSKVQEPQKKPFQETVFAEEQLCSRSGTETWEGKRKSRFTFWLNKFHL